MSRMRDPAGANAVDAFERLLEELHAGAIPNTGEWLARVVDVIRPRRRESLEVADARLHALVKVLEARPDFATALNAHVGALLTSRMHRILYADSSVLANQGFAGALARRVMGRLLPPAINVDYLRDLVAEVFEHSRDHVWMMTVPRERWDALLRVIGVDAEAFEPARRKCRHELLEAMRLVAVRLAALGTDPALLQYLPALARHESPFIAQAAEVRVFIDRHGGPASAGVDDGHLEVLLGQCEDYVVAVRRRSREAGVSVGLVYLLASIEQVIARLRLLRDMVAPRDAQAADTAAAGHLRALDFFLRLLRQENRRNSVRDLFRGTIELLARRVTEQASRSGEHYITESRDEFVEMYRAAAGAGLIIAFMALVKLLIARADLPLVWEGAAFSFNYGLGFVLIHVLHLTIATKQPAMTAATLAGALDGRDSRESRLNALADLAAEVSRTQWVSIAGNVTVAVLTAFAITLTAARFLGWESASPEKAAHLLHDLHPWHSLALLAACVEHNLGALAGNFLFGCMLGGTPVVGELLGLPLDIRHVAFASANLAYGLNGLEFAVTPATVVVSVLGVLLIGLTNLVVSFGLALRVALRSRGIGRDQAAGLWARVLRRFLSRPRDFFWPSAASPEPAA